MLDLKELASAIGEAAVLPTVGHELRTPLTSICGYLETILEGDVDAQTTRRFLETAQREAVRLAGLIDTLLRNSASAGAESRGAVCDVAEQIRVTVETIAPLARRRGVTIRTAVPAQAIARIDGDECIHALTNLTENAVKHGCINGTVAVDCRQRGGYVEVTIDDDGIGVIPGERLAVFELGVRGTSASAGCGIGLAVVQAIARRAGGEVSAEASNLGGARFVLRLLAG